MTDVPTELEAQLNDFNADIRAAALRTLLERQPQRPVPPREIANLHCHTFCSFNAYGYSPSALAWLARQQGLACWASSILMYWTPWTNFSTPVSVGCAWQRRHRNASCLYPSLPITK